MAAPVEIVIKATDRFSPAFESLASAFKHVETGGSQTGLALEGLQQALADVARRSVQTGEIFANVSAEAEQRFKTLTEEELNSLDARAAQQIESAQSLGEQLLSIDEEFSARRASQRQKNFEQEQSALGEHQEKMEELVLVSQSRILELEKGLIGDRLRTYAAFSDAIQSLAEGRGRVLAQIAKAAAIAEALINAYLAGSKALASVPFPFNIAAAAAVTAQGLATVERIRQVNIAHGGIENVPEDATFLLRRGERVLAPDQNRDLTRFLSAGEEGAPRDGVTISNLTVHVLENATNAESLLAMDPSEMRRVVMERILPALDDLAALGIKPRFVDSNT